MVKWLLKSSNQVRLECKEDVDKLENMLRQEAQEHGYNLTSFKYSEKEEKEQGEVVGIYYVVDYTFKFAGSAKDPEQPYLSIDYKLPVMEAQFE